MYRRTKKYNAARLEAMRRGRERARMSGPAPDYPQPLPEVRLQITVERFDPGCESAHVFTLKRSRRVDQYRVEVDGEPWRVAGLSRVLEMIRKGTPRMMGARNL